MDHHPWALQHLLFNFKIRGISWLIIFQAENQEGRVTHGCKDLLSLNLECRHSPSHFTTLCAPLYYTSLFLKTLPSFHCGDTTLSWFHTLPSVHKLWPQCLYLLSKQQIKYMVENSESNIRHTKNRKSPLYASTLSHPKFSLEK